MSHFVTIASVSAHGVRGPGQLGACGVGNIAGSPGTGMSKTKTTAAIQRIAAATTNNQIATRPRTQALYCWHRRPKAYRARHISAMSRYKSRHSAKAVEQDFPHYVDVVVPPSGLGTKLDAMYDFHAKHGIKPQRGHGRHDANGSIIRWCFADVSQATAFASKFRT
jgi:hypothetical protein